MKLFIFPSLNITNIWAGVGAGKWAVAEPSDPAQMKGLKTKSLGMPVGSAGVIYRTGPLDGFFTTPFIVYSSPDQNDPETQVWDGTWVLPFRIHPLGTPRKRLTKHRAEQTLPILKSRPQTNITSVLTLTHYFVPSEVSERDWEVLLEHLAE